MILAPAAVSSQASDYLPSGHPIYGDLLRLEQLSGKRLGLRRGPLTRAEAAAALNHLRAELDSSLVKPGSPPPPHTALAADLARRLQTELTAPNRWVDAVSVSLLATNSRPIVYDSNGLGRIDARNNPMLSTQASVRPGVPAALRSDHVFRPWRMMAIGLQPELQISEAGADDARLVLQQAYVRVAGAGLALDAGRVRREWGPSRKAGLLLSANARAPWGVAVGSEGELRLPSLLRYIGPVDFEVFWADLGDRQYFPGANLFGWRASVRPLASVSIGAQLLQHYGGAGAPSYDAYDFVRDVFLPFLKSTTEAQFSNKLAGIDFEVRVPQAAGLTLYGELMLDDVDTNPDRFRKWIREDVGHVYGLQLDGLKRDGTLSVFAEYQHTGHRYYRHHHFLNGLTYEAAILGTPLGPDGDALYLGVAHQLAGGSRLALEAALENRSNDVYFLGTVFVGAEGFIKLVDRPNETRTRLLGAFQHQSRGRLGYQVRGGFERVVDEAFVRQAARFNHLLELSAEARFR